MRTPSTPRTMLRVAAAATSLLLGLSAAGCGSDGFAASDQVTVVSQDFPEARIMTALYKGVLEDAGLKVSTKELGTRDIYLKSLKDNDVQVAADYLSSMTEQLNRDANGTDAEQVASNSAEDTLAELQKLAEPEGLTALDPAKAQDANAFAVTKAFSEKYSVTTLTELGQAQAKNKLTIALAGPSDCQQRPDCGQGLADVYQVKVSKYLPLGFGTPQTKSALKKGEVQVGEMGTTDPSPASEGFVILTDDKGWQNAENLVPVVNSEWLKDNSAARDALDKLSATLTTEDLAAMIGKVADRELPAQIADEYLQDKGLV